MNYRCFGKLVSSSPYLHEILRLLHIDRQTNTALFNTWGRAQHEADEAKFLAGAKELATPFRSVWKRPPSSIPPRPLDEILVNPDLLRPCTAPAYCWSEYITFQYGGTLSSLHDLGRGSRVYLSAEGPLTLLDTSRRPSSQGDAGQREATPLFQHGGTLSSIR